MGTLGQRALISLGKVLMRTPDGAVSGLVSGRRRTNRAGMVLDAKAQVICAVAEKVTVPYRRELIPKARAQLASLSHTLDAEVITLAREEDVSLDVGDRALPARLYSPLPLDSGLAPVLVYYHGGGFVNGDLDSHGPPCRRLAVAGRCAVLAVDYRRAPEDPFPAAVEDAEAAFRWVVAHGERLGLDPTRVAVGGDSAGANLAAVTCIGMRDRGGPHPVFQLLYYPVTDARFVTPSHQEFAAGYFLTRVGMDFYLDCYCADPAQRVDPRVSPLLNEDLRALPDALVVTAGFDPLRDEAKDYAEAMRLAGGQVEYQCYEDMIHAFISMAGALPQGARALTAGGEALQRAFARRPS